MNEFTADLIDQPFADLEIFLVGHIRFVKGVSGYKLHVHERKAFSVKNTVKWMGPEPPCRKLCYFPCSSAWK